MKIKPTFLTQVIFSVALLGQSALWADKGISVDLGNITPLNQSQANLDFGIHVWHRFDPMVFLGVGSGVQTLGTRTQVPALMSVYMRLPFGSTLMPIAVGDFGWRFGYESGMSWRYGGGLDLKLGSKSCITATTGIDAAQGSAGRWFTKGGLLLEF